MDRDMQERLVAAFERQAAALEDLGGVARRLSHHLDQAAPLLAAAFAEATEEHAQKVAARKKGG